jgi:hypothetical protein
LKQNLGAHYETIVSLSQNKRQQNVEDKQEYCECVGQLEHIHMPFFFQNNELIIPHLNLALDSSDDECIEDATKMLKISSTFIIWTIM